MTMSIGLVNLKPGVGKTTSAAYLGAALHEAGLGPLGVDADKGGSFLEWDELAGGLGFPVIAKPTTDLHASLPDIVGGRQSAVLDLPQIEDHARIARSGMRWADTWIIPVAPSGIEVDRMMNGLRSHLEEVQSMRDKPAEVWVLFNRTNTSEMTRTGPDAEVREVLAEEGFFVLDTQIQFNDGLYRQTFGTRITAAGTRYADLLDELLRRKGEQA